MNHFELISKFKSGIDEILKKSARGILSRVLVIALSASLIPTGYFVYVGYLQGVVEQQGKVKSRINDFTTDIYLIQATIKELELCLSSKYSDSNNHKWYCESAVSSYQRVAEHWPPVRREKLLRNNAIPAMVIDAQYYLMIARDNLNKVQASKSNEEVLLETLLTNKAIYALVAFILLVSGYVVYRFEKTLKQLAESHNNSSNADAEGSAGS